MFALAVLQEEANYAYHSTSSYSTKDQALQLCKLNCTQTYAR